ncbi:MAG: hypothetical protein ABIV43_03775, partial [Candidatus Saccharimonadales bacterium]
MTDIDIPFENDRHGRYRFFEILPGALSWSLLLLPVWLSYINIQIRGIVVNMAVVFILFYLLVYFVRSVGYTSRALAGYRTMKHQMKLDWPGLVADLEAGEVRRQDIERPKWHADNMTRIKSFADPIKPSEVLHAVIIATVNETREVLEPTVQALIASEYDCKRVVLVFAYEGRAGQETADRVQQLVELYQDKFYAALAFGHPANIPGEIIGKGGNVTYAGRQLAGYLAKRKVDPATVLVTTLDADNRPDRRYLPALTYVFCCAPNRLHASYQPLPMFTNNIWDAPTLMRVIATGNNLFYLVGSQRPHLSRNFSAHAQPLQSLIDMDFWSVRTVVEDGHHFWRSFFHFDGDYRVYPMSIPIYQDAVLADGYLRTMRAQFVQLRRWTYGASDVAYVAEMGFFRGSRASRYDVTTKFLRLLEGHVSWATGALLVLGASRIPPLLHPQNIGAIELPLIVSRVQTVGIIGLLATVYVCLVTLPPRPARYRRHRSVLMVLQWGLAPLSGIGFGSL